MTDWRNELEIQVLALQRSGSHAILAWIFQQFDEPVFFFNNVRHFGNPILEFQPLDLPNAAHIRRGKSPGRMRQLMEIGNRKKKTLVYSYENLVLSRLRHRPLVPNRDAVLGCSVRLCRILIVRDFYNWLASRIRYHEIIHDETPDVHTVRNFTSLWLSYAREYLGETEYTADASVVPVSYNLWVADQDYRRRLLGQLAVPLKDNSISYVPRAGGGSSFDATTFCGRPHSMAINDRWRYLKEEKYERLVHVLERKRREIDEYNNRLLGYHFEFF